ncbi:MAG: GatB/YqeY domain-containing protein [Candidatus Saccharimonadales bacterium]
MPDLKARINADLKTAMLARDEFTTMTLRGLKAAILNEEVAKGLREEGLSDEVIEQLIARESKKRDEAAGLFEQGGNQASADKERAEKKLLSAYLPEQLSDEAVIALVDEAFAELKPEGMKDMGRVIGAVKARGGNSVDGSLLAKLVKERLQ